MQIPNSSLGVALNILASAFYALLSYILGVPVHGHRLTIGRLALSAAHDIRYEATLGENDKPYSLSFKASALTWRFHVPRAPNPRLCVLTMRSIYYTSTTCDISSAQLEAVVWFFPVLFRQTSSPWTDITLDDLRILVYTSTETPYFIRCLRQNLVSTLLTGEVLRADVFRTSMRFSGLTEHPEDKPTGFTRPTHKPSTDEPDGYRHKDEVEDEAVETDDDENGYASDSDSDSDTKVISDEHASVRQTQPLKTQDDHEICFNIIARQLLMHNTEGRIYSLGRFDSQVRRDWTQNRGSFVLVAEECRWVHVHFPFERVVPRSWLAQLCSSLFHFPIDLVRAFNYPVSGTNLYVTRLDVTFDSFRLRDAELLKQGFSLIREKSTTSHIDWSNVFLDAITQAFARN
ncbi:hypothetical protein C8Q74DRAFT_1314635 [Fomes fomentarius]|nr:hypothetical protein C8Q74DRAFT_1314635 [Fomes fomentarius]